MGIWPLAAQVRHTGLTGENERGRVNTRKPFKWPLRHRLVTKQHALPLTTTPLALKDEKKQVGLWGQTPGFSVFSYFSHTEPVLLMGFILCINGWVNNAMSCPWQETPPRPDVDWLFCSRFSQHTIAWSPDFVDILPRQRYGFFFLRK